MIGTTTTIVIHIFTDVGVMELATEEASIAALVILAFLLVGSLNFKALWEKLFEG